MILILADVFSLDWVIGESKFHAYDKRQRSDWSWKFLKLDNEPIKTAQKILMDKKIAWNHLFLCRNNEQ